MIEKFQVLVVDDEEELVTTLAERLELRGFKTQVATEGSSALKILESSPPDVVLLDVMMPGMGGLDFLREMNRKRITIPVILLTGYGSAEKGDEGIKLGAYDYLMKPCNIDILIAKLTEAVNS